MNMHLAFLNPQGNFDPEDSYWTAHPDFGGQLVYVKQLALAMGDLGHRVDILTRRIEDPDWPEFAGELDAYPGAESVRIIRLPAGPPGFLPKEELWPYLVSDWVPNILDFYRKEGGLPDALTAHYGDGGVCAALIAQETGIPYTFTAHSLGAQKMDKMHIRRVQAREVDARFHFGRRLVAERLAMNRSMVNVTSTEQERFSQYTHNAYRGAVDPTNDARFGVVPPGVNLEIFDRDAVYTREEEVSAHIREALARDLRGDRLALPCIVASSRLDAKKNHLGLLKAFASSAELRQQANLVIITGNLENPLQDYRVAGAGERAVLDSLMEIIDGQGLRGQVSMFSLRNQQELAAGYRFFAAMGSVFALTAHYEPFGLAPLEAMAAGLPAVVTKMGGPSESLREGDREFGLLVDPNAPEEVSGALYSLVVSRDRWEVMAEAGYERVLSRYTWQRTAEGYLRLLELAREKKAAPRKLLTIHPYFLDPTAENDVSTEALDELYFQMEVLCVGETVVDFISHEQVNSLRAAGQFRRYLGGQPANVAVYVAKVGARSAVVSRVGDRCFGDFLEEQLQRHGVNTEALLRTEEKATTHLFLTRTNTVADFQVNRGADTLLDIKDISEELVDRAKAVHTSCFALSHEPERSAVRRALRLARRLGKVVSLDPNYRPQIWPDREEAWEVLAQIMPYVDIVKPSLSDARHLFDFNLDEETLEVRALETFHDLGARVVVLTRSGGLVTVSDGSSVQRIGPLPTVQVDNVTGGRDAFWSGLLVAHLDGKPWPVCVRFAHEIAALKLNVIGHVESMIDREAIYRRLEAEDSAVGG
jgi:sucrose-phosphate synthase